MRKILIGVVSVAGLLAVVLALASSPASAAKDVVTITSATEAGVYTVTWNTKGGCDPGSGTSGASGEATLTVIDADGGGTGTTGTAVETGVVTDTDCTYEWKASFVRADGSRCKIADPAVENSAATLVFDGTTCNYVEKVTFTVSGYTTPCVNNTVTPTDDADCTDTTVVANDQPTADVPAKPPSDDVKGAVKETTFTVTAVEKPPTGQKADPECATVSGETKLNDTGVTQVELALTDQTFNGRDCVFTVTAELPPGFATGDKGSNSRIVTMTGSDAGSNTRDDAVITPVNKDLNNDTPTDALDALGERSLEVTIATRTVYLVQNVIGDAGGANATYKYSAPCGAPGLPGALGARKDVGGIQTQAGSTIVELRTGRFNVSAAIGDESADGTKASALNKKGVACDATVSISGVPAGCSAEASQSANLATSDATVILEFTIDCTPAPAAEPPADDGGDMMDDGGDMMDDGGDGGDMMDDGGDGPMMDAPTG